MEIAASSQVTGWTALTHVSCFQTHAEIKKQLNIFGQLDAQLDYLEYLIRVEMHKADQSRLKAKKRKKQLSQQLVDALKSLKNDERIYYYNTMVDLMSSLIRNQLTAPQVQNRSFLIIQSYTRSYNLKIWKQKKLRFDRQNHIIYAQKDKKIKIYDLANYIVRRSNSTDYFCIVLEAINGLPLEKSKTVHIGFEFKNSYNLWFCSIQSSVKYKLWQRMAGLLGKKSMLQQPNTKWEDQSMAKSTSQQLPLCKSQSFYSQPTTVLKNKLAQTQTKPKQTSQSDVSISIQNSQDASTWHHNTQSSKTMDEPPKQQGDELALLRSTFANRLINQHMTSTLQQLHCECQRETESLKMRKNKASIHRILLQSYQLSCIGNLQHFHQITAQICPNNYPQQQFRVYEQDSCPLTFKLVYHCPNTSNLAAQAILHSLLQAKQCQLNIFKTQIKFVVLSQNITINREQHPTYNRLYRPRQFVYVRHLLSDTSNNYFIIDRSVQQPMIGRRQNYVRAQLFRVTKLQVDSQRISVVIDFRMRFNGQLRNQQELNHAKKYIQNMQHLLSYVPVKSQQDSQLMFYDCQRIIETINQSEDQQSSINISISQFQNDSFHKTGLPMLKKQSSFYHIPCNFLQHTHTNESLLQMGQQLIPTFTIHHRNTYSPPRQYCKPTVTNHAPSFLKQLQSLTQNTTILLPLWSSEWQVDEQRGGLTQKSNDAKQKKIFKEILQNVSRFTLIGKDLSQISFPVQILAPESTLERAVKALAYAPHLFSNNQQMDTLQKLKQTVVFSISISLLSLYTQRAFNSQLGQTFQGRMCNNSLAYAEQLSISPQIAAVLLDGEGYSISGCIESRLQVMLNSVRGQSRGMYSVRFGDQVKVDFTLPHRQLSGLCFDQRTYRLGGKSYYWLLKECLFLEINFEVNGQFSDYTCKTDQFEGIICQITPQSINNFILNGHKPNEQDIVRRIETVKGRWTKSVCFQSHTVELRKLAISDLTNSADALQSDSSFRADINELKNGNAVLSQQFQLQLSTQQRKDEQLRKTTASLHPQR